MPPATPAAGRTATRPHAPGHIPRSSRGRSKPVGCGGETARREPHPFPAPRKRCRRADRATGTAHKNQLIRNAELRMPTKRPHERAARGGKWRRHVYKLTQKFENSISGSLASERKPERIGTLLLLFREYYAYGVLRGTFQYRRHEQLYVIPWERPPHSSGYRCTILSSKN